MAAWEGKGALGDRRVTGYRAWDRGMLGAQRSCSPAPAIAMPPSRPSRRFARIVTISTLNTIRPRPGSRATSPARLRSSSSRASPPSSSAARHHRQRRVAGLHRYRPPAGREPREALPQLAKMSPLGRLGQPGDMPTSWRCSPDPTAAGSPGRRSTPTVASDSRHTDAQAHLARLSSRCDFLRYLNPNRGARI